MNKFKKDFPIDPEIIFLNHGSYGSCPISVFSDYQKWQKILEKQPVEFFQKEIFHLLKKSRNSLSEFVGCNHDEIVFFPNPTTAVANIIHSLDLNKDDEILMTNHEYGALVNAWKSWSKKSGAKIIQQKISIPVDTEENFLEQFWSGVSKKTKVIFISQITSPTALVFPVKPIIDRAKEKGILTIIDGAHVPGHIELNINALDCDFYTGALHKWLCMPKGSTFLFVKYDHQKWIKPIVRSWGKEGNDPESSEFLQNFQWQGTNDMSSYLTVPKALDYYHKYIYPQKNKCFELNIDAYKRFENILGTKPISNGGNWIGQMVSHPLPEETPKDLKDKLWSDYRIEIPIFEWNDCKFIRSSFQIYNQSTDVDYLMNTLESIF